MSVDAPAPEATADDVTQPPRRRRRWPWITAAVLLFALLVAGGMVVGATVSYADSLAGRLLPGTSIAGVDVSGMTQDEALRAVRGVLADELDRRIVVRWEGREWATRARRLGAHTNARGIVADVAASQQGLGWQDWARLRWLGERSDVAATVEVDYRRRAVRAFVAGLARDVELDATDATLTVEGDDVAIGASAVGYDVVEKHAVRGLLRSLRGDGERVDLRVRTLEPEVTEAAYRQVLLLDQSEHRLTLHLDGEQTHSWIVATGTGDYPTPLGQYEITLKRYMPTWVNPSPDGWGKDMPAQIAPGPKNPLGVRALNWDAPAIRFHGTQAIDSLGTDASHGCVRMSNADVTQLYDLIDVGAVIVSRT